jgi:hypothetical protein
VLAIAERAERQIVIGKTYAHLACAHLARLDDYNFAQKIETRSGQSA